MYEYLIHLLTENCIMESVKRCKTSGVMYYCVKKRRCGNEWWVEFYLHEDETSEYF